MTAIEIAGLACGFIGTKGPISFDEDSDAARQCKTFYGIARDACFEDRIWTFATKRFELAPHADPPLFGYLYKFEIPSEVVRVHRVDERAGDGRLDWRKEGGFILADVPSVCVIAGVKEEDTSLYSPNFTLALAAKLASLIVIPLKEDQKRFETMVALHEKYLKDAAGTDGSQGRSERVRSADSIADRR